VSFVYVGIYWGNHHHLFHLVKHVDGRLLWANNHLLFWLSLVPFSTGWMGENHFATWPTALYGFNLLMCGAAYGVMVQAVSKANPDVRLTMRRGATEANLVGDPLPHRRLAFVHVLLADALAVAVAVMDHSGPAHREGTGKLTFHDHDQARLLSGPRRQPRRIGR
jgi:uncharacterized membrane protein